MHPVLEIASVHLDNKKLIREISRLDTKSSNIASKTCSDKLLQKRLAQVKFINMTLAIIRDSLDLETKELEYLYIASLSK